MFFTPLLEGNLINHNLISEIIYYPTTRSTNKDAWELYKKNNQTKILVISDNQTAGEGRYNNSWFCSPGKNITCSLLLNQLFPIEKINIHALLIPVAIILGIKKFLLIDLEIKWPNDILFKNKKLGGILIESKQIKKKFIFNCGIGLNVNEVDFPLELKNNSTSLKEIKGHTIQREPLLAYILNELTDLINNLSAEDVIKLWLQYCCHINKKICFKHNGKEVKGIFKGLDEFGMAIINHNNQTIQYSGEITTL